MDVLIHIIMLVIIFISLYVALVWLNFMLIGDINGKKRHCGVCGITIAVPAHNEENSIKRTVESIMESDYPKDKLELIVINDGSKDNTLSKIYELKREYPNLKIISHVKNVGKAASLNLALNKAKFQLFGVVDADSEITHNAIKNMIHNFENCKVGAVISTVKVKQTKGLYAEIQRLEYNVASIMRRIMSIIGTLHISHGVLCLYRTDVLKKIKGFDTETLTEDFEIAMRLKYNDYDVKMQLDSIVYTNVPETIKEFWNQRIRWFRGFVENMYHYKSMTFDKSKGLFAFFQMPLNMIMPLMMIVLFIILLYNISKSIFLFLYRTFTIHGFLIRYFTDYPTLERIIFSTNMRIFIPLLFVTILGVLTLFLSIRKIKERIKNPLALGLYLFILPTFASIQMANAVFKQIFKFKKKW